MTLLGWQKLRTKICLLRACSNCKAIAEYDPYRWILQLWDNGLLNWTTFFFHFMLFLTLDKVLPWWCMLSSFISNNWRSIKYIIEKAWSCSQSGVGKLYGWLMCEQNLAPGTSCLWAETSKHLFHRPDLHLRVLFSRTRGQSVIPCVGWQPPTLQGTDQRNHRSTSVDVTILKCFFPVMGLSISSILPQTAHQLQAVLWGAAPHCGIRAAAPPLTNSRKCQVGSFNLSARYLPHICCNQA